MTFLPTHFNMPGLRLLATTALITSVTFGLGACESSKHKYGLSTPSTTASISHKKKSKAKRHVRRKRAKHTRARSYKIAVAPIGGLPKRLSKSFAANLKSAIKKQKIARISNNHKMSGYFAATPKNGKTKLSYVLDVTNKAGKRIKRIHGSEIVAGHPKDPWKNVSPSLLRKIARKTASNLSRSLNGKASAPVQMAQKTRTKFTPRSAQETPSTTASLKPVIIATPKMAAIIPPVQGAPGDGKVSLTRAIAQQLAQKGIKIETLQSPGVHSVKGFVSLKSVDAKRDEITIKWLVFNSAGRRLGVVSQKNKIAKGSLNGAWGRIANAAAGAAAKGIRKLLPSNK